MRAGHFQSHYGAIATQMQRVCALALTPLSIPLWCDCNSSNDAQQLMLIDLSIPLWCDCNSFSSSPPPFIFFLSIPLWCDCNLLASLLTPSHINVFQSHYGAIATWWILVPAPQPLLTFNPTMVRLQHRWVLLDAFSDFPFNPTMVRLQLFAREFAKNSEKVTFNPTMVRLQRSFLFLVLAVVEKLSIPLWCDCNVSPTPLRKDDRVFQSHYGAIATMR